jgi:outer membrane protein assembly factor BamB
MRVPGLALILTLTACGEHLSGAQFSDGAFVDDTGDPGDKAVYAEVQSLPWKHVEWEYKFTNRQISRMTLQGDQLFLETPDYKVIAMDRFTGKTSWIFTIDTHTPLDWAPVVAQGVPEEIRQLELDLVAMARKIDDKMKEVGPGKETQELQKKRNEIRERLRVAAFGDNCYFISREVLYCLDRLSGYLRWTHRLTFIPSARPFAIRNYVFIPGADLARVWVLDVEKRGNEITHYRASIVERENQIMNAPVYSDPSLYFVCHDGKIYCYKVTDGTQTWAYQTERAIRSDPLVYVYRAEAEGTPEVKPGAAPAAAPAPGAMNAPAQGAMNAPAPAAGAMNAPAGGAMDAGGAKPPDDGKAKKPQKAQVTTRFLFVGGTDNAFYALDGDAGALIWKYECGGEIKSPAIAKDSTVYVRSEEGALHAFEIMPMHRDPKTNAALGPKRNGNLRWKVPLAERFIFKGKERVYIMGPKSEIWAMNEMTGDVVGRYKVHLLQHIMSNTVDDYIYVANAGGYVFCLKESRQSY